MKLKIDEKSSGIFWCILVSLCLVYLGLMIPGVIFLSYLPVILIILRWGYGPGLLGLAALGLFLAIKPPEVSGGFSIVPFAYTYLFIFSLSGLGLSMLIKQGFSAFKVIGLGSSTFIALVLLWAGSVNLIYKINPAEVLIEDMKYNNQRALESYRSGNASLPGGEKEFNREQLNQLERMFDDAMGFIKRRMGVLLVLFSIIGTGLSYFIGARVFAGHGIRLMKLPEFSKWRPTEGVVWGLILGGILYFGGLYGRMQVMSTLGLNIGTFFLTVYFISGFSTVSYILHKYKVPVLFRVLLYVLLVMQFYLSVGIGVADVWFDFRKRIKGDGSFQEQSPYKGG